MKIKTIAVCLSAIITAGLLPSCSITYDPITRKPIFGVDPKSLSALTGEALRVLNEK